MKKQVGFTHESQKSASVEWYTPPEIFNKLGIEFDIDVCSPKGGLPWIPAKRYFDKEIDGLKQEWSGTVWCNPPYGRETTIWLERMSEHKDGIALVFARTDCKWFHDYVATADAIMFLKGRIKFVDGNGKTGGSGAGNGSMLVAWGEKSVKAISKLDGFVVYN
jgi:phage N-6-adenine-methyltransferase